VLAEFVDRFIAEILAGCRPVPGELCRCFLGEIGDVTGLAGNPRDMGIQARLLVRRCLVAVLATDMVLATGGDDHRLAGDLVVFGLMALLALEVVALHCHVDVNFVLGVFHRRIEVAMFYGIATAAEEVAAAAVLPVGCADVAGDVHQVDGFIGMSGAGGGLLVGAGGIVADQAVDVLGLGVANWR